MAVMKDKADRSDFSAAEHLLEEIRVALEAADAGSFGSRPQADLIAFDLEMPTWDGFSPFSCSRA